MAGHADGETHAEDVAVRRKTAAQKDNNQILRQQQIDSYKAAMSKEARAQRSRLRRSEISEERKKEVIAVESEEDENVSPRKKKKVDFELSSAIKRDLEGDPVSRKE